LGGLKVTGGEQPYNSIRSPPADLVLASFRPSDGFGTRESI